MMRKTFGNNPILTFDKKVAIKYNYNILEDRYFYLYLKNLSNKKLKIWMQKH